jgi:outer membrane receptor protein involved in Fe transport
LYSFEGGLYLEDDWSIRERLKVNIGVRLSQYHQEDRWYVRPEPRVSGRFMLNELTSVKASYALMNQYIHLLSNTGIGLPTDLWVPATNRIEPQQSQQWAIGFARDIPKHKLMVSLEGYYKVMNNIIAYKEGASFLDVGIGEEANSVSWQDQVTAGTGSSYGLELLVQRKVGKLTGWIGYTLSWTTLQFDELNNGESFFARYDRRHDASIVGIYEVNDKLTLSATWVYGTGQAITLPLASYTVSPHDPAAPNLGGGGGGIGGGFPVFAEDYGGRNEFRMAAYHRLDIAAQWKKQMKRCVRTFELGVYNAYNRWNPFYYYSETNVNGTTSLKQISLFPIIPSVSWSYKF